MASGRFGQDGPWLRARLWVWDGKGRKRTRKPWFDNGRGSAAMCMEPKAGESTSSRRARVLVQQASGTATRPKTGYGRRVCVYRLCTGAVCVAPASAKSTKRCVRATAVLRHSASLFCLAAWRPRGRSTSGVTVTESGAWQRRSATHEMSMTEQLASGGILQLRVAPAQRREYWDSETGTGGRCCGGCASNRLRRPLRSGPAWSRGMAEARSRAAAGRRRAVLP